MPALPDVPGVLKFEFLWTQSGIPCANIFHASYSGGPPTNEDCVNLGQGASAAFWVSGLYSAYPTSTVFVGVRVTDLTSSTASVGEYTVDESGTYEGSELPAQACVLVNYTISRRYRGGHPRVYILPPNQTLLAGPSEWDSTIVTELSTCITALQTYFGSGTSGTTDLSGQVCVSYVSSGAPRVDPLVELISGAVVSPIMATQRRRIRASSY